MKVADKNREPVAEEVAVLRRRIAELEKLEAEHKQAEEALRDSEMELSTTLDNVPIVMLLVDRERRVQKLNQAAVQFAERPAEEMIGLYGGDALRCLHSFDDPRGCGFGPDCQTCVERLTIMDTLQTGNSHHQVEASLPFLRGKKQEELTFLVSTVLLTLSKGAVVLVCIEDITERKRAEEEVKFMALFAELNPAPVMRFDKDGKVLMANKAAHELFGAALATEVSLSSVLPGIGGLDLDACIRKGVILSHSVEIGDRLFHFVFRGVPDLGVGQVYGSDITKRRQAQEELRESEERYRSLMELGGQIGEAIIMLQDTAQGEAIQTFVSDEWTRITGYSREELLGRPFFSFVHHKHWVATEDKHRRRMAGESIPGLFEISIVRKDNTEVPIELTSAYTTYKGERASVVYIRDITARKWMEEQLVMADRLASIGELAAGVAHELNNPLTGIIGFSELLLEKNVPDDIKEDLAIIHHEALRTAEVIKNLLAFGRKRAPSKQPVNITTVIARVLGLRAYEQKLNNIRVDTRFAHDLPDAMTDSFQLQQVFLNIIINAEYFMMEAHKEGTLVITTERVGDMVRASFTDDGPGISADNLKHLFDPFFTTKAIGEGTGLGLSICYGTVTEHGGRIYAESELGKGATFVVELPVIDTDGKEAVK